MENSYSALLCINSYGTRKGSVDSLVPRWVTASLEGRASLQHSLYRAPPAPGTARQHIAPRVSRSLQDPGLTWYFGVFIYISMCAGTCSSCFALFCPSEQRQILHQGRKELWFINVSVHQLKFVCLFVASCTIIPLHSKLL